MSGIHTTAPEPNEPIGTAAIQVELKEARHGLSPFRLAMRRLARNRGAMLALIVIVLYIAAAILSGFNILGLHDKAMTYNLDNRYAPMFSSWEHPLGTDNFGRDVFARSLMGTRLSLFLGFASGLLMIPVAIVIGSLSGYYGRLIDEVAMYVMSVIVAIPSMLIILSMIQIVGRSFVTIALAFAFTGWVGLARVIRGSFIQSREFEYVLAARALGANDLRIIFKHIIPNVFHFVIVQFVLNFVSVIKSEVFLAYLGLSMIGVPTWGNMIDIAKQEVTAGRWQNLIGATLFMFVFLAALNIFGDALRDALDPKLKNK